MNSAAIREALRKLNRDQATALYWKCNGRKHEEIGNEVFERSKETVQGHISSAYRRLNIETESGKAPSREELEPFCTEIKSMVGELDWPNRITHWPPAGRRNQPMLLLALIVAVLVMAFVVARFFGEIQEVFRNIINPQPTVAVTEIVRVITATPEPTFPPTEVVVVSTVPAVAPTETQVQVTETLIPSDTPQPTLTPTIGSGTKISDSNVTLELVNREFNANIGGAKQAISYKFQLTNITFEQILVHVDAGEFVVKDNLDRQYPCRVFQNVYTNDSINVSVKGNRTLVFKIFCGRQMSFDASVEEVTLFAPSIYSLEPFEWVVKVAP